MILYVVRHALAEDAAAGGDDARHLTGAGRQRTQKAAAGMRAMAIEFDVILSSPLVRAAETAAIIAEAYENTPAPRVLDELSTGVPPIEAIAALAPFGRDESVMIVGHEPQLSALIATLLTGEPDGMHLRMRKGACVALDLPAKRIEPGAAELLWMMTQRQLRQLRKKRSHRRSSSS
jgi:phosphohistidine phosphatase